MSADGRARDGSPVVEHLGDVDDPACHLADAKREVVVLGAVVALAEPADARTTAVRITDRWEVYI